MKLVLDERSVAHVLDSDGAVLCGATAEREPDDAREIGDVCMACLWKGGIHCPRCDAKQFDGVLCSCPKVAA